VRTNAQWQTTAARLFASFAGQASDAVFTQTTGFTYSTKTSTTRTQTVSMVRTEFDEGEIDGEKIKQGDYKLIGRYQDLSWPPAADNTTLTHAGIALTVKHFKKDAADAAFTIRVRRA
jgi:hypothetical protein